MDISTRRTTEPLLASGRRHRAGRAIDREPRPAASLRLHAGRAATDAVRDSSGEGAGDARSGVLAVNGDGRVAWLLKTTFSELNGEVSPDGRWLVYQSNQSGQFEIYARPFPGVDEGRLLVSTGPGWYRSWAQSGRELFYVAPDGSLMGVPVDLGQAGASFGLREPVKLVEGRGYFSAAATPSLGRTYDATPDGTRFLRIKRQNLTRMLVLFVRVSSFSGTGSKS